MYVERLEQVLIVGSDEHHDWCVDPELFRDEKTAHVRHLDIEKDEIDAASADGRQCLDSIPDLPGDSHVGIGAQQDSHCVARRRLIVDDQDSRQGHGLHASCAKRNGNHDPRAVSDALNVERLSVVIECFKSRARVHQPDPGTTHWMRRTVIRATSLIDDENSQIVVGSPRTNG